ncbi:SGNH/GDSL hydrolase family protein [Bacillus aerolatus]|uniref:SGNH/GDSL hydrolase family protein n=1 Tax=Bacillus aerolatus TaxID=2653354 RepID=A0A6I1FHA6_9BACI|nr:SGNH/GDSL hydrolase family protein [Bacillus aerolatus]
MQSTHPLGYLAARYVKAVKDSAVLAGADRSDVVVVFGDSNTEGTNWFENGYDVRDKWVNRLAQHRTVINAGVGGNTSEQGRIRFQRDVLSKNPKVVIIMFGTNDAVLNADGQPKVTKAKFEENLRYFTDTLQARQSTVILMTTIPVIEGLDHYYARNNERLYGTYGGARMWHDSYNEIVRKVAREKNVLLVDNYQNITQLPNGISDETLVKSGLIDPSGTHFTPQGANVVYWGARMAVSAALW